MKTAPFSKEEVELLNRQQRDGRFHPFTCCSPSEIEECERKGGKSEGVLIATEQGWVCPCGKYKQDWYH